MRLYLFVGDGIFRRGLSLPQSATLTAPSKKEPDSALADSFAFRPLSLATLDSFAFALSVLRTALPEGEPRKMVSFERQVFRSA